MTIAIKDRTRLPNVNVVGLHYIVSAGLHPHRYWTYVRFPPQNNQNLDLSL